MALTLFGWTLIRVSELEAIVARLERTLNEFIQNIRIAAAGIEV